PIIIASLALYKPVMNLGPESFANIVKKSAANQAPRKLSEMLRLKELHLTAGRIAYHESREEKHGHAPPRPMVWDSLGLDADLSQQSPSRYNFHLRSRSGVFADASAAGAVDVDELML